MAILMRDENEQEVLRKRSRGKIQYGIQDRKRGEPRQQVTSLAPQPTSSGFCFRF